jgi:tRNA (cmo5U34)-methyltransferase
MASLALHHVASLDEKRGLYGRIASVLAPGGVFVNADVALPSDADAQRAAYRYWADHQVARGIPEARAWQNFEDWAAEDTYFSIDEEVDALDAAGLTTECVWRDGPIAVLVGRKGGARGELSRRVAPAVRGNVGA